MNIVVKQTGKRSFEADRPEMPGSPIVGRGATWKEALGDLLTHGQKDFNVTIKVVNKSGKPFGFRQKRHR